MNRRHLLMLLALAALWGASFLLIKVAVRELTPATLIVGRLGLAALTLALLVPCVVGTDEMMRQSGHYGPKVAVPDGADEQTRLIGFLGRQP